MFVRIDTSAKKPIYLQICDQIKTAIASGDLMPGVVLPTVRQLAGDLGINFNTVAIAYRELEEQGLVRIRHGSGVEVCADRKRVKSKAADADLRARLREVLTELRLAGKTMGEVWEWLTEDVDALWGEAK